MTNSRALCGTPTETLSAEVLWLAAQAAWVLLDEYGDRDDVMRPEMRKAVLVVSGFMKRGA